MNLIEEIKKEIENFEFNLSNFDNEIDSLVIAKDDIYSILDKYKYLQLLILCRGNGKTATTIKMLKNLVYEKMWNELKKEAKEYSDCTIEVMQELEQKYFGGSNE